MFNKLFFGFHWSWPHGCTYWWTRAIIIIITISNYYNYYLVFPMLRSITHGLLVVCKVKVKVHIPSHTEVYEYALTHEQYWERINSKRFSHHTNFSSSYTSRQLHNSKKWNLAKSGRDLYTATYEGSVQIIQMIMDLSKIAWRRVLFILFGIHLHDLAKLFLFKKIFLSVDIAEVVAPYPQLKKVI